MIKYLFILLLMIPLVSADYNITLIAVQDLQTNSMNHLTDRLVSHLNNISAEAYLFVGDLMENEDYLNYTNNTLNNLSKPWVTSIGNHDADKFQEHRLLFINNTNIAILGLDWSIDEEELSYYKEIMNNNSEYKFIILVHDYLNFNYRTEKGDWIKNNLIDYTNNTLMIISGHHAEFNGLIEGNYFSFTLAHRWEQSLDRDSPRIMILNFDQASNKIFGEARGYLDNSEYSFMLDYQLKDNETIEKYIAENITILNCSNEDINESCTNETLLNITYFNETRLFNITTNLTWISSIPHLQEKISVGSGGGGGGGGSSYSEYHLKKVEEINKYKRKDITIVGNITIVNKPKLLPLFSFRKV